MELVKKNIVSVICGVVAILAIVASFFPLGGYVEDLQASLNKSKTDYSSLETLRTKPRMPYGPTWAVRGAERATPNWDQYLTPAAA